jgi:dihydrodipicolinate synthase/N-acetylneuraminate lyase
VKSRPTLPSGFLLHVSGCVGGINGLANILGDEVCNIYKLFTKSKLQEAVELHLRLVAPNAMVRNKPQRISSYVIGLEVCAAGF